MVFSAQNRRTSLLVISLVTVAVVVCLAVLALELIQGMPGHAANGCGSVSRLLIFGTNVAGFIGLMLKLDYSERRQRARIEKRAEEVKVELEKRATEQKVLLDRRAEQLQTDVRHDFKNAINPITAGVRGAVDAVVKTAEKVENSTNGGLARAIEVVAKQVRDAQREQLLADPRFTQVVADTLRRVLDERDRDK